MCTQSVGLLSAAVEQAGIPTACIALVRPVAVALRAPRMLAVPYPFGRALGAPDDAAGQLRVLRALLAMLGAPGPGPLLRDYAP